MNMIRTTVYLLGFQRDFLALVAAHRHISRADVLREALVEYQARVETRRPDWVAPLTLRRHE